MMMNRTNSGLLYGREESEDILTALGLTASDKQDISDGCFTKLSEELIMAALWYRSLKGYQDRIPSYRLVQQLEIIHRAAGRVLKQGMALAKVRGIPIDFNNKDFGTVARPQPYRYRALIDSLLRKVSVDPDAVEDGIRDHLLQGFLRRSDEPNPDFPLRDWLTDLAKKDDDLSTSLKAAHSMQEYIDAVLEELNEFKRHFDRSGDTSIAAEGVWLDTMLMLFKKWSGKEIKYYRPSPASEEEGQPAGDVIDFLTAAGWPIGFTATPRGWATRVDRAQQIAQNKK
jgi:hypothetical protein